MRCHGSYTLYLISLSILITCFFDKVSSVVRRNCAFFSSGSQNFHQVRLEDVFRKCCSSLLTVEYSFAIKMSHVMYALLPNALRNFSVDREAGTQRSVKALRSSNFFLKEKL